MVCVTADHQERVVARIAVVQAQIKDLEIVDASAASDRVDMRGSVNSEHDRQCGVLQNLLRQLEEAKYAKVAERPTTTSVLRIEHLATFDVTILRKDGSLVPVRERKTEHCTYFIGGYGETDTRANPQVVSYRAPCILPFMNKPVGHSEVIPLGGGQTEKLLKLIKIEFSPERG